MLYQKPSFTCPAAPNRISQEAWDKMWEPSAEQIGQKVLAEMLENLRTHKQQTGAEDSQEAGQNTQGDVLTNPAENSDVPLPLTPTLSLLARHALYCYDGCPCTCTPGDTARCAARYHAPSNDL